MQGRAAAWSRFYTGKSEKVTSLSAVMVRMLTSCFWVMTMSYRCQNRLIYNKLSEAVHLGYRTLNSWKIIFFSPMRSLSLSLFLFSPSSNLSLSEQKKCSSVTEMDIWAFGSLEYACLSSTGMSKQVQTPCRLWTYLTSVWLNKSERQHFK